MGQIVNSTKITSKKGPMPDLYERRLVNGNWVSTPKTQKTPVTPPQSYAQIPDYIDIAKQYLPAPKPLTPVEQMPEYKKAMSWDLPQAQKLVKAQNVDPQVYENKWKLSSDALRDAFYGSGGVNDGAVDQVLERGLGTSGDRGRVVGEVAEKYAKALADARTGIDIERMSQEAAINNQNAQSENSYNQFIFGNESARNQSMSNAAMSLLNARGEMDMYESRLPFEYGQAALSGATGLANSQNDILAKKWEQDFQTNESNFNREMQSRQLEEQQRQGRFDQQLGLIGEVDFQEEDERAFIEQLAKEYNFEIPKYDVKPQAPTPSPYGASGAPFYPGTFNGQEIRTEDGVYRWNGRQWGKLANRY